MERAPLCFRLARFSSGKRTWIKKTSYIIPVLRTLTVNGSFMRELVAADAPCVALGVVEEGKRRCGCLALRPDRAIPREVSNGGFRFGYSLLGNDNFEVVHFAFEFYGLETYHALVKPNNALARAQW